MMYKKKTWQEKLADKESLPKILKLDKRFPCYNALHKMGVSAGERVIMVNPSEIIACLKEVPYGKLITIVEICRYIAKKHHVKGCCCLTTGIFIMTAANAVEEAKRKDIDLQIPYWRTLKVDGYLNEKYPGGTEAQKTLLENEGYKVERVGKRWRVKIFQDYLLNEFF
jgi:alkylated DNA nucleotide flippase Atl1